MTDTNDIVERLRSRARMRIDQASPHTFCAPLDGQLEFLAADLIEQQDKDINALQKWPTWKEQCKHIHALTDNRFKLEADITAMVKQIALQETKINGLEADITSYVEINTDLHDRIKALEARLGKDIKHLNWLYARLVNVHGEREDVDYMLKFKEIIGAALEDKP